MDDNNVFQTDNSTMPAPAPSSASNNDGAVLANQPLAAGSISTHDLSSDENAGHLNEQFQNNPPIADDIDLIEKEWVKKIEDTIQSTKNNPYELSQQLTIIKLDYLQKRYNKIIKTS